MHQRIQTLVELLKECCAELTVTFDPAIPVNLKGNFCMMLIRKIEVDGTGKLFITDINNREQEFNDELMYQDAIMEALERQVFHMIPIV